MESSVLQLTDSTWVFPCHPDPEKLQPNVGIIISGGQTVLVDGGNSPHHARSILNALDELNAPPVRHIIYTHSHFDHFFGAQVFGAPAIAHELCRQRVQEMALKPWSYSYIEDEIQQTPERAIGLRNIARVMDEWRGFRVIVPTMTFTAGMRLYLGDLRVDIEHVGGQHSPDSSVVRVPSEGIIFVADAYYPPVPDYRQPGDTADFDLLARLLADETIQHIVDGHSTPLVRDVALALLAKREG
ncbi:MAG: MBL fold metallo-hydrolase [Anaerolineaceae bacterium]|nr:MBL fold metallo-hydrolase [Anaerolineaceae bacterium]